MWTNGFNVEKLFFSNLLLIEVQQTQLKGINRKVIKYKNRFLLKQHTITVKTTNLFVFKGFKLKYLKIFSYASLFFFRHINTIKTPLKELQKFNAVSLNLDVKLYPAIARLINESYLYHTLNTIIPLFLAPSLPMIKTLCLTKKHLKKKKALKAKLAKYTLHYVYVPHSQRALVISRWFGMIVKTYKPQLVNSFIETTLNVCSSDENSFIIKIRNQVYAGLSLETDI